jgi:hypothetical protein
MDAGGMVSGSSAAATAHQPGCVAEMAAARARGTGSLRAAGRSHAPQPGSTPGHGHQRRHALQDSHARCAQTAV